MTIYRYIQSLERATGRKFIDNSMEREDEEENYWGGRQIPIRINMEYIRFGEEGLSEVVRDWQQHRNKYFNIEARLVGEKTDIIFYLKRTPDGVLAVFCYSSLAGNHLLAEKNGEPDVKPKYNLPPQMYSKLHSIMIPEVRYKKTPYTAVLQHLSEQLKMHDPQKCGFEIELAPESESRASTVKFFFGMQQRSGLDILDYICKISNAAYRAENGKIIVSLQ